MCSDRLPSLSSPRRGYRSHLHRPYSCLLGMFIHPPRTIHPHTTDRRLHISPRCDSYCSACIIVFGIELATSFISDSSNIYGTRCVPCFERYFWQAFRKPCSACVPAAARVRGVLRPPRRHGSGYCLHEHPLDWHEGSSTHKCKLLLDMVHLRQHCLSRGHSLC
jgi:hypothetical protein